MTMGTPTVTFSVLLLTISLVYVPSIWRTFLHNRKLRSIPAVGPSGTLTSYIGAIRFLRHSQEMVQEGYDKYHGSVFKIPTLTSWFVVASGGDLIDEFRRTPDEVLSAPEASRLLFYSDITIGPEHIEDPIHAEIAKGPLTKNIGARFDDVRDEIVTAFDDYIPATESEWTRVTAYSTIMDIVCRASNRMFVGLPLCRDPDWMELNKALALNLIKGFIILSCFPAWLRPVIAPLLRSIPNGIKRGAQHLEPLIRERFEQQAEHGKDWPERPNDIMSWLIDVTKDRQRNMRDLVNAVLLTNFASIHTTTMSFTYIMYELATRPEYAEPLRDEIEAVIKEDGWSKDSVSKLWKMDGFIKECLRLSNFNLFTMMRTAMRDITLPDGTTIPAGSTVVVPFNPVHTDANDYTDPSVFDGFRFEKRREQAGEDTKHQLVSLGTDYVLFGLGRHACPGRFFAANELKVMLAHVVMNYDVKMADGKGRPENWQFGIHRAPDTTAQMLFRKRRAP
ncbi:hypothetical protein M378DRAFT_164814 [Amanita muscaria Koide BX008]|uniref:Cytochrome P450 n=1 Tax=Amanita muscaria (strain Koide BX008) TaxID=946122 RepID=A0A0C2SIV9_AMAMK|nr:hypothetical protein M378DRAFT_164814 [Amanita muscaria Koide BX008]